MKKIAIISDVSQGGAATACRRLRDGLAQFGSETPDWIVAAGDAHDAIACGRWPGLSETITFRLAMRLGFGAVTVVRCRQRIAEAGLRRELKRRRCSVLNIHNIHQAVSFKFLENLPSDVQIVWTLHDMWALTGYCCYSYECEKYLSGCNGDCPQSGKWGVSPGSPRDGWRQREAFYSKNRSRLLFVCPSRWLTDCVTRRFGNSIRVEHIPNGVDLETFKPLESKLAIRDALGLRRDQQVILAGCQSLADPRKGTVYLLNAVKHLRTGKRAVAAVVLLGTGSDVAVPEGVITVGNIRDEQLLNLYYNAADVFVLPSLADNLPNVLLESVAAGTPCVAFDSGGCSDVVRNGESGFIAKSRTAADLADCIERVLALPENERQLMRDNCRRVAEREYGAELQAERYLKLFEEAAFF